MNLQYNAKSLLIPVAAFAVTATGVSAFDSSVLEKAGLSETQINAFETAHDLRDSGNKDAARDVLIAAGVNIETMQSVREAAYEDRHVRHEAIYKAVMAGDFNMFQAAIVGSPLEDIVTTEADFSKFKEAVELKEVGDIDVATNLMTDLGFSDVQRIMHGHRGHGWSERGGVTTH